MKIELDFEDYTQLLIFAAAAESIIKLNEKMNIPKGVAAKSITQAEKELKPLLDNFKYHGIPRPKC